MEVKEKSKKRELIKTIAIIFLVILLLLTFFSNTIMNRSLPEVATQSIVGGTINAKIRGSGTVTANESYEVNLKQTRTIHSICVKVGDTVEQGALLFVLEDGDSEELRAAQEQLAAQQISYQKQLLSLGKEYAAEDRTVAQLQKELEKAQEQVEANFITDAELTYAKGDLAAAKTALDELERILEELEALMTDSEEYQEAKAAVDKWTSEVNTAQTAVETYQSQLDELEKTGEVDMDRRIEDAENALDKARNDWKSDWLAYKGDLAQLIKTIEDSKTYTIVLDETKFTNEPQKIESDDQIYIEAYITANVTDKDDPGKTAYETLLADQNDVDEKEKALKRLQDDRGDSDDDYDTQVRKIRKKLNEAEDDLDTAQRELRAAERDLESAEGDNTSLKNQIKDYEAAKRQRAADVETYQNQLSDLEKRKTAYDTAVETVEAKTQALEDAMSGKDIDKQIDDLDLQSARLELQKLADKVEKLKTDTVGTEITAPVAGTISAINVSAGKETDPGVPMATIDVTDRGYTVKISVTNDQAKQIKVGDTANVTNYYWGNNLEAVVEAITADPASQGRGKLVVFRVSGEIDPGTNITLSIGQRSANYDTVVPKSALRSDSNGDFVLVITEKSTPLGPRYIATRADVQILAQDDTSAAVSGLVSGDFVITTSSKPLSAGTQVRLVESQ